MAIKWSKRKDNIERVTISVRYHVPREMAAWIVEMTAGYRHESGALAWIREHVHYLVDGRNTIAARYHGYDDELLCIPPEEAELYETDGFHIYDGPTL